MDIDERPTPIHPAWVIGAIAVVGILGATAVFVTAGILDRRDRAVIAQWEREALPLVEQVRAMHARMPAVESRLARLDRSDERARSRLAATVQSFRSNTQTARRRLHDLDTPDILDGVASASFTGLELTLYAVTAMERQLAADTVDQLQRTEFRTHWERARRQFGRGRVLLARVRCRAKVDMCTRLPGD